MSNKLKLGIFIVAVIFTIVIATAPPRVGENRALIDSLRKRAYNAERREQKALEEARIKDIEATTWYNIAESLRTSKTIYITRHHHDTVRINSLTPNQLDSTLQSTYPKR